MLIETMTGNQNFPGKMAKAYVFVTPTTRFPRTEGETHLFTAAKEGIFGIRKHSGGGRILAAEGMTDAAGFFNQTTYDIPEGVLLKVFASKKPQASSQQRTGSLFLLAREHGPLQRVEVVLNDHPGATVTRCHVEGRFDILSLEDAEALGARVLPLNRRQFFAESVKGLLTRRQIAPELKAKTVVKTKVVQNTDGQEVKVQERASRRILDV